MIQQETLRGSEVMEQREGRHHKVELKDWPAGEDEYDRVDLDDEGPSIALKAPCPTKEADIVVALQDVDDPSVLRIWAKEVKKMRAIFL
eukprot:3231229-Prorocentrum_lima.AAC.1